ncbi:glyoxalase superfamily protein [Terrimonas pollutisoli]|uniref:glyoxalase superfamily protein n=1 Tax=Terrimonas pollutisoli TaxID=3034147 RepID=UPI0023EDFBE1|nr:glyoxalase superfamily protein [Terrimonas sp. H1YJ31]
MKLEKSITILYSTDIKRSLAYYTEKLGFDDKWEWDCPPTFGGVVKDDVEIFFCEKDQGHPGTWLCIVLDSVDEYYESIKDKGANIIALPESKEWNMREMLIKDPDGHIIRFGNRIECE